MMTSEARLPSLFGRLSRVLTEHERLGQTTSKLADLCGAVESGRLDLPAELEPGPLLAELRRELSQHFAAEEADTHFGAVARERPALLPDIVALKDDHRTMLRVMDSLELIARDETRWVELPVPIAALLEALRLHERAEAHMLEEYFSPAEQSS